MSAPTTVRYRAEVIGSLLRPDYLKQAVEQHDAGQLDDDGLRRIEDRAVLEAIRLQEDCGIDALTDGEMRRKFWFDPLTASLSGYNPAVPAPAIFTSAAKTSAPLERTTRWPPSTESVPSVPVRRPANVVSALLPPWRVVALFRKIWPPNVVE